MKVKVIFSGRNEGNINRQTMSTPRVILFKPSKPKLTVSQLGDWEIVGNLIAKELGRELGLHVITGSITLEKAKKIIVYINIW